MSDRLTPQGEAEIAARATSEHLTPGPWRLEYEQCDCSDGYCHHGEYVTGVVTPVPTPIAAERIARTGEQPRDYDFHRSEMGDFIDADWELMVHAREDVPALLAELAAVRAERDQARGELTAAQENYAAYRTGAEAAKCMLADRLNAITDLCDRAEAQARRWEHPLPFPEWVTAVRQAAERGSAARPASGEEAAR